jgi:hypothetical protein
LRQRFLRTGRFVGARAPELCVRGSADERGPLSDLDADCGLFPRYYLKSQSRLRGVSPDNRTKTYLAMLFGHQRRSQENSRSFVGLVSSLFLFVSAATLVIHGPRLLGWSSSGRIESRFSCTRQLTLQNRRVFDMSLYNGEAFLLLVRLRTLSRLITRFLISYSNSTFSRRHPQPLTFAPYESEIASFGELLRPVYVHLCKRCDAWGREGTTRMTLIAAVLSEPAQPDDLVTLSDADELIDPAILVRLVANPPSRAYSGRKN